MNSGVIMFKERFTESLEAIRMSPIVTIGNSALLDGDDETPFPNASTVMTKKRSKSIASITPEVNKSSEVPVNHVGNKMAFDRSSFSRPVCR